MVLLMEASCCKLLSFPFMFVVVSLLPDSTEQITVSACEAARRDIQMRIRIFTVIKYQMFNQIPTIQMYMVYTDVKVAQSIAPVLR